jgi:hypothetical protein
MLAFYLRFVAARSQYETTIKAIAATPTNDKFTKEMKKEAMVNAAIEYAKNITKTTQNLNNAESGFRDGQSSE